jgi:hypothetical protein
VQYKCHPAFGFFVFKLIGKCGHIPTTHQNVHFTAITHSSAFLSRDHSTPASQIPSSAGSKIKRHNFFENLENLHLKQANSLMTFYQLQTLRSNETDD